MIKIKYRTEKLYDPYYILQFNYMIGDAKGYTNERVGISLDNPYTEKFITLINSLKPFSGTWELYLIGLIFINFQINYLKKILVFWKN